MKYEWEDLAYALIKQWEKFRSLPYQDGAGIWTIGYGSTHYENGKAVGPHDPAITEVRAQALMASHCRGLYLQMLLKIAIPLANFQWAAIISFAYNEGVNAFLTSTMLALINQNKVYAAGEQFTRWDKMHDKYGRVVENKGLLARRTDEQHMFRMDYQ